MPPAGSSDAKLLILGSLPGEASLRAQRYYAHPQNQFWRLLGRAIGEDLAGLAYEDRVDRLAARRIALWDVVGEGSLIGSLDLGDIVGVKLIDLPSSSPAYTLAFGEKAKRWDLLGPLAWPPEAATLEP